MQLDDRHASPFLLNIYISKDGLYVRFIKCVTAASGPDDHVCLASDISGKFGRLPVLNVKIYNPRTSCILSLKYAEWKHKSRRLVG
jgi:hypothetical protein